MKFFKTPILLICAMLFAQILFAQTTKTKTIDSSKFAPVQVTVVNSKKEPRLGEEVIFTGNKTKKVFTGRTNKQGKFFIQLPVGDNYTVTMKAFTDSSNYGTLSIPALGENQFYKTPFDIDITFEPARVFTLDNVYFDNNKATLRPESFKQLNELFDYLNWKTDCNIEIAGHTDNVGKDEDNMVLSQKRAEAVKTWLVKKGIPAERITAKGYGDTQPIADNSNEEGRQKNRRTEVRIL